MKRVLSLAVIAVMVLAGTLAIAGAGSVKLPKCSSKLCRDIGCPPDILCVQGAHVVTCAEWCGGH